MATIHMTLQGKGGVGKSFVAAALAQYATDASELPRCFDTDPVNRTFAAYEALRVEEIDLMAPNHEIDPRNFDVLLEQLLEAEEGNVVIDNGAASFVPLQAYMLENEVPAKLQDDGHELNLHAVITGGQGLQDTVLGLSTVLRNFPSCGCFVWLNPVHGEVVQGGCEFEEFPVYLENRERIAGIVRIPELNAKTAGRDLADLLKSRRTFAEAAVDADLGIMVRQRLKIIQRKLYAQIEAAKVL